MSLKEDIIQYADQLGIDQVGFTSCEPFLVEKKYLEHKKANNLISPFEEQNIELRCFPEKLLPNAKTIICFALGYLVAPYKPEETNNGKYALGKISRYAQVKDYHIVLGEKLKKIVEFISKQKQGKFKIFIDTGSLIDKAVAQRAGIGWIGANTCLFTEKYGSWVFLGEVLTDIEIEPDEPIDNLCNNCGKCIKACPTGALVAPYVINPYKCLSYITQMGGIIPQEFLKPLGYRIFGCDTCQEACPKNNDVVIPNHNELLLPEPLETNLYKLYKISKNDFNKIFSISAAGWRGRNIIRRNAICALNNMDNDYIIKVFNELTNDPSKVVKEQTEQILKIKRPGVHHRA